MAKQEKKITANIKMRIPAGQANAGPPVGSTLGQYGVNMMDFVTPFNDQTKDMQGQMLTAHVSIYDDKSITWRVVSGATDERIRKAVGIDKGSGRPHEDKVATLTKAQLKEIAEDKMEDMNANDIEAAMKQVAGTARSMGVEIES
jgi:large subunit ribosomal protein L11